MDRHACPLVKACMKEVITGAGPAAIAPILQAAAVGVAEVPTAVGLQQVSGERRNRADLRSRERARGSGECWVPGTHLFRGGDGCNRHLRAEVQPSIIRAFEPGDLLEVAKVDQGSGDLPQAASFVEVGSTGPDVPVCAGRLCGCLWKNDHARNPSRTRSGRIGMSLGRQPVASNTALPIAAGGASVTISASPTERPSTL